MASSRFTSNFENIRKPRTYKCSDKRSQKYPNYLNETKTFTMYNGQVWEVHRETDCHSASVIYYLKCNMCNKKEAYIGKIGDYTKGFKVRINQQHISDCKIGEVATSCMGLWYLE